VNVRVLQIQIEADIGDAPIRPAAIKALAEYFSSADTGHMQDETFYCRTGTIIRANHYYRYHVSLKELTHASDTATGAREGLLMVHEGAKK